MTKRKGEEIKEEKEKKGFSKSFLEGVPFLGGLVKELSKTQPFKKRFEDVDKQIGDNLRKGGEKELVFESNVSVRPIIEEVRGGKARGGKKGRGRGVK